jgi:hypothetical protein
VYAFYGAAPGLEGSGRTLKDIPHEEAIRHIVATILQRTPEDGNIVVPLVCHFDEHGAFTTRASRKRAHFIDMLRAIGSAVTSSSSLLREQHVAGRFFIVPITTGTSQQDANVSSVSNYHVLPVPLPVLSFDDTKKLAKEYFRLQNVATKNIASVLELPAFQVGLADTAGLPGLVGMVCSKGICVAGSYSEILHTAVTSYTSNADVIWAGRWPNLATLILARPVVNKYTEIHDGYTVANARDSGTILFQDDNEIRVSTTRSEFRRHSTEDSMMGRGSSILYF